MTAVNPQRIIIQQEETQDRASVAASTVTRLAAASNHAAGKIIYVHYNLNGPYFINGPQDAIETPFIAEKNYDIIFVSMAVITAGISGNAEVDIRRYTGPNTPLLGTSIFSTRPLISWTAGNFSYLLKDVEMNNVIVTGTGITQPVMSITQINQGEMLSLNLTQVQTNGEGLSLKLTLRER
jgi:hypothetical protein